MRHSFLRHVVWVLLLLTLVGGGWLSATAQAGAPPCMMAMDTGEAPNAGIAKAAHPDGSMPCEDGTPACMKRLCCLVGVALLVSPLAQSLSPVSAVRYPPDTSRRGGRSIEPELFPPIHA